MCGVCECGVCGVLCSDATTCTTSEVSHKKKSFLDVDEPISEAQKNSLVSLYNGDQGLFMFLLEISNNWENNVYHESV